MDIVALRLLFVAGLVVMGGLALLVGTLLFSLTERWSAKRAHGAANGMETRTGRPGVRALSLDRSSARVDTCQS